MDIQFFITTLKLLLTRFSHTIELPLKCRSYTTKEVRDLCV